MTYRSNLSDYYFEGEVNYQVKLAMICILFNTLGSMFKVCSQLPSVWLSSPERL